MRRHDGEIPTEPSRKASDDEGMYYCVVDISTGKVLALTPSIATAAHALAKGTCYGKAPTQEGALEKAVLQRWGFLASRKKQAKGDRG